ncbi:MAG: twitching motility protein PilT [Candidatus Binatia bacterium]|nr:MAG: twitching motility protein PilT [Candidatus Binatia bacterium]
MKRRARLLLDTHVFLWWRVNDRRLRKEARQAIADAEIVFVSAATAWEIAIKIALGRLRIPEPVEAGVKKSGFEKLPIDFAHAESAARLPPHHADPFDRMLVAQAREEGLVLVTGDRRIGLYDVDVVWT